MGKAECGNPLRAQLTQGAPQNGAIAKPRGSSGCGNPAQAQLTQNSAFEGYLGAVGIATSLSLLAMTLLLRDCYVAVAPRNDSAFAGSPRRGLASQ
jgi:hypothetical protein